LSATEIALLVCVAFAAGVIDAIAGGGGLLTVPALLMVVPNARFALGTNKAQSVFGSFAALISFVRQGRVDRRRALPSFLGALSGSVAGARLVLALRPALLRPIVLVLLVAVAAFFAVRRPAKAPAGAELPAAPAAPARPLVAFAIALVIGAYDGFFGPGTGTFLIVAFTLVFKEDLTRATANAKVANFASNLGAVAVFASAGTIDFRAALPMAAAQALGGVVGARAVGRGGERLVRLAVLVVTVVIVVKIAVEMLAS
jgi:uncharacterized protein